MHKVVTTRNFSVVMGLGTRISKYVDSIGSGPFQICHTILAGAVWFADGSEMLALSSVSMAVQSEWHISKLSTGSLVSVVFIGALVGCLFAGQMGDTLGRRWTVLFSFFTVGVASLASAFATNYELLVFFRFFVGIGFGAGHPACNALISEICASRMRIVFACIPHFMFAFGEMYSGFLVFILDPSMQDAMDWRQLIVLVSIPAFVFFAAAAFYLVESPHFLAVKGRINEAEDTLQDMRQMNGAGDVDINLSARRPSDFSVDTYEGSTPTTHMFGIFGKSYWFTTCTMCFSLIVINFTFFGTIYALPQILGELTLPVSPAANLMISAVMEMVGVVLGCFIGLHLSRKAAMIGLFLVLAMSTIIFAVSIQPFRFYTSDWAIFNALTSLYVQKVTVRMSWIIVYTYLTEVYPTVVRSSGPAICIGTGR